MARSNKDQIKVDRIDHTDWRDPGGLKIKLNLAWLHKDKMRALLWEDGTLWLRYENVSAWAPGSQEFAHVWVARQHDGKWVARYVTTLRRDGQVRDGVDPSGHTIFRHAIPTDIPTLPDSGEDAAWFISGTQGMQRLGANRLYTMPDTGEVEEPGEPEEPGESEEPESLLPTVKQERAKYPTPVPNDELGTLLNTVAWQHRAEGWGLAEKFVGARSVQPHTGTFVSRDLLIHRPSSLMYDVLQDVAEAAVPVWNLVGSSDMPWVAPVDPDDGTSRPPLSRPARWPSAAPYPQMVYGPQVDRIRDKGVDHWVSLVERHGFHGILIPCAGLPLNNTGIKTLAQRVPFVLLRLWGDEQRNQTPDGGLIGSEARAYYRVVFRLLGQLGIDRWGATAGFDLFEWASFSEIGQWVALMQSMDPHPGRMYGARARTRDDDPPNSTPNPGTYKPWAIRVESRNKSSLRSQVRVAIADSGPFPVCAEDGFRERPGSPNRPKDWTERQMLKKGFEVLMEEGVAATWARFPAEGTDDDGSVYWTNPARVRSLLQPDEPPPPDCEEEVRVAVEEAVRETRAADAASLDAIEDRLQAEVFDVWDGLSFWQRFSQASALIHRAETIIAEDYRPLVDDMRGGPRKP